MMAAQRKGTKRDNRLNSPNIVDIWALLGLKTVVAGVQSRESQIPLVLRRGFLHRHIASRNTTSRRHQRGDLPNFNAPALRTQQRCWLYFDLHCVLIILHSLLNAQL
jgi:hypothetical protein